MKIDFGERVESELERFVRLSGHVTLSSMVQAFSHEGKKVDDVMTMLEVELEEGHIAGYAVKGRMTSYSIGSSLEVGIDESQSEDSEDSNTDQDELKSIIIKCWPDENSEFTSNGIYKKAVEINKKWRKDKVTKVVDQLIEAGRLQRVREAKYMGKKYWYLKSKD